jgi:outer membrane lipoprotein-sorting protein
MPRSVLLIVIGLAALITGPVHAQTAANKPAIANQRLSEWERAKVEQASRYLASLDHAQGRFIQTDPRGIKTQGSLYLQRPGKIRFAYDPPQGLLVVSDGYNVSIADSRLKTFDKYPLSATPLALLLSRNVSLEKGVVIDQVSKTSEGFSISAHDGRKQAEGRIRLEFSEVRPTAPLELDSWTVTDAQGQSTRIDVIALRPVAPLRAELFQLKDPRVLPPSRR